MEEPKRSLLHQQFPQLEAPLLDELPQQSNLKELHAGDAIAQTGNYMRSNILLLGGLLKVYREDDEGNDFLLYYLEPGNACALSMMCSGHSERSPVMARAVSDAEVVLVPAQVTEAWLAKNKK